MKRTVFAAASFAALALFLVASPALARQKPRVLDKDTFMNMEAVSSPAVSPDGRQIVFTREYIDVMKDQSRTNLWIVAADGSRLHELTSGAWRDASPVWSPDSRRVAFLSDRDGTMQLHVLYVDTGAIAQLTHLERPPAGVKWSPDGRRIAFTSFVPDEDPILPIQLPKRPRGAEWARTATIVDRLSWGRDGTGPTEKGYNHAFVLDAVVGGTPRQITDGKYNHSDPEWAPDGQTVYVVDEGRQTLATGLRGQLIRLLTPTQVSDPSFVIR